MSPPPSPGHIQSNTKVAATHLSSSGRFLDLSRSSSAPPIEKIASALPADLERELGLEVGDALLTSNTSLHTYSERDSRHSTIIESTTQDSSVFFTSPLSSTINPNMPSGGRTFPGYINTSKVDVGGGTDNYDTLRRDPKYATFFHGHARLDPRLPAPEYRPGQSILYHHATSASTSRLLLHAASTSSSSTSSSGSSSISTLGTRKLNVSAVPYAPEATAPTTPSSLQQGNFMLAAVLDDLRLGRPPRYGILDLSTCINDLSCDQHGSRFVQQRLELGDSFEVELIFQNVTTQAPILMVDVFGNYVIQKLFELGSERQRVELARTMHGHVVSLSLQMYGCRVVQKALEHLDGLLGEQAALVNELQGEVLDLVRDQNGNHVIQKCIELLPLSLSTFILDSFRGNMLTLATHPYGCRVIQRLLEHDDASKRLRPLLLELEEHMPMLVQDQYGNYVMQHLLERGTMEQKRVIIAAVLTNLSNFSCHKFASNVVERCIVYGDKSHRQAIVAYVCNDNIPCNTNNISNDGNLSSNTSNDGGDEGECPLFAMMRDQYANYVVQKMLEAVEPDLRDLLIQKMRPHYHQMRKYAFGKHILSKLERLGEQVYLPTSSSSATSTSQPYNYPHPPHLEDASGGGGGLHSTSTSPHRTHLFPSASPISSSPPSGKIVLSGDEEDFPPLSALSSTSSNTNMIQRKV